MFRVKFSVKYEQNIKEAFKYCTFSKKTKTEQERAER